ncbi:MAG: sulfite oxidase [Nitrospira sp.]|nr:sulfite oxidase [Nitrospira sp.]
MAYNQAEGWFSRRTLLGRIIRGVGLLIGVSRLVSPAQAREGGDEADEPDRLTVRVARPLDAETPVQEFVSALTPNSRFFVRSHFGSPAREWLSDENWQLSVAGLVDRPLTLTLQDLKQFEAVTLTAVVQCSGNGRALHRPKVPGVQWERGAVGNARWTGVRLRDILQQAGVQADGRHVQFQGADRPLVPAVPLFVRSIPVEKALHQDTILAYEMNGRPLPLLHGAPLRVITPGWMAASCIKWLIDITVREDEAQSYYMQTAYRYPTRPVVPGEAIEAGDLKPVDEMVVKSLIAQPQEGASLMPGPVMIQGVAWTGEGSIVQVDVSLDEGRTWEPARLIGEDQPYAWRQWQYLWTAATAGPQTILCRATDDRGATQPEMSPWNPSGFLWNGWDRVNVMVAG